MFFPILGVGVRRVRPTPESAPEINMQYLVIIFLFILIHVYMKKEEQPSSQKMSTSAICTKMYSYKISYT